MNQIEKSEFYQETVALTEKLKVFCGVGHPENNPIISAWKYMIRNRNHITARENVFGIQMNPGDLIIQGGTSYLSAGIYLFSKDKFHKSLSFSTGYPSPFTRILVYFDAHGSISGCIPLHLDDFRKSKTLLVRGNDKREEFASLMIETSELIKKIIFI